MEYPNLKEIEGRPKQYWNADGLPDLLFGFVWIMWGTAYLLPELLPPGKWLYYYWWAFLVLLVASAYAANWAIRKLKQRLTFPRTGYVEWRKPGIATRIAWMVLAAGMAAGTVLLMARRGSLQEVSSFGPPAAALFMALGYLIGAIWHKLPHLLFSSALSLVLAGVIAWARFDFSQAMTLLLICLGLLSCLVGVIRLRIYLRRNPQQQESEI